LAGWLAEHVASGERRPERVREELILRCRAELIEPPTPERVSELARSALHQAEQVLLALIADRLDAVVVARLEALIAVSDDNEDENVLGLIKAAPGNVSLGTMLVEISKLEAIRAIALPADLFDGIDARIIAGWRARAAVESPVHLREHPQPTKLALLCALLCRREREVTDALAQLLISTVHRINARSEEKVITELVKDFKRVTGTETLLRKIAEASLGTPDDTVHEVILTVVGGEATLQDLVAEYRQKGTEQPNQPAAVVVAVGGLEHLLFGIARNKLASSQRRGVVEANARQRLGMAPLELTDDDLEAIDHLGTEDVLKLLDDLPIDQRQVVHAHVIEERSYTDIAEQLRCSEAVVRKRVSRGLAQLRDQLGEESA
jgi:DNA-binding Lrp family transcriptional regulator